MLDNVVDIVVTSSTGHFDLVVQVKLSGELEFTTTQLSEYMSRVGASVGLVVGREAIRILRDTYRSRPSIHVVGEFPIALARGLRPGTDAVEFEVQVQKWLE